MTANTPPKPHIEGMEWTNTETGIKYQYINGAWRTVSSELAEDVADAIKDHYEDVIFFSAVWTLTDQDPGEVPGDGEWNVDSKRKWNRDDDILLNVKDKSGNSHVYGNITVGSVLEIKEDENNYCKYEVERVKEEDSKGIDYLEVRIESVIEYKGEPHIGADAVFSFTSLIYRPAPNLEDVLTAGSVADQSILLTNLKDDAILLNPDEGRINVLGYGPDVVPRIELRHTTAQMESGIVMLGLDEGGSRFDIGCDEKVDNIHFRFEKDDKLILNKKGDAVFTGKVKVQPGTEENEAVTYQQLIEIEEEIESISPSIERGSWTYINDYHLDRLQAGKYFTAIVQTQETHDQELDEITARANECFAAADSDPAAQSECSRKYTEEVDALTPVGDLKPTTDFTKATALVFNKYDLKDVYHSFNDVEVGDHISLLNQEDDDYLVGIVTSIDTDVADAPDVVTININLVQGIGETDPDTNARVRIFSVSEGTDVTDFVKKTGDTMTGNLQLNNQLNVDGKSAFKDSVRILPTEDSSKESFIVFGRVDGYHDSALLLATNNDWFRNIDDCVEYFGTSVSDESLVTKQYVDNAVSQSFVSQSFMFGIPFKYRGTDKTAQNLQPGEFFISDNKSLYVHHTDALGRKIFKTDAHTTLVDYEKDRNPKESWGSAFIKVYTGNGDIHHIFRFKEIKVGNGSNKYVRYLHYDEYNTAPSWSNQATYYLADGLLMPY